MSAPYQPKQILKYYPLFGILLISAQLAASVLGPRTIQIGSLLLPGGIWSFPLTFFLWDIVTEVYGFARARQLILYYLIGQIFFAFLVLFGLSMPSAPYLPSAHMYGIVLGDIGRLTISMVVAIVLGDFVNCYILAKMKSYTNGKYLWMRLMGATALGELVTSLSWVLLFYFNKKVHPDLIRLIACQYVIKILFEAIAVIPTYVIVAVLEKIEGFDSQKRYINFDPKTCEPLYTPNRKADEI